MCSGRPEEMGLSNIITSCHFSRSKLISPHFLVFLLPTGVHKHPMSHWKRATSSFNGRGPLTSCRKIISSQRPLPSAQLPFDLSTLHRGKKNLLDGRQFGVFFLSWEVSSFGWNPVALRVLKNEFWVTSDQGEREYCHLIWFIATTPRQFEFNKLRMS